MKNSDEKAVISSILSWAESKPDIRAVILTSSRAKPDEKLDEFSDYDVIITAKDIKPYLDDKWLGDFGKVLVVYRDPVEVRFGFERFIRVTQYENGLKIDFTFWPVGLLKKVTSMKELPDYIDDGYKVLLDKDGLTRGMQAPSCRAFVPKPPTKAEYLQFVEEFFSNAPYAAKHIRRGDLFPLKGMLNFMRYEKLCRMLEWKVEIYHEWSLKQGQYGKGLQKYLDKDILRELKKTFDGEGDDVYWKELHNTIELFRKTAKEVGSKLGYAYPEDIDSRVIKYLEKVRSGELP
ncbi:MAG: aminoglycoside 6-adenylyltransferase [Dehalococcoidales bacterium]|nr:aminoglycoside 6-adenylyltransferase [Dehalococcoidales bacterium]